MDEHIEKLKERILEVCHEEYLIDRRPGDEVWSFWQSTKGGCWSAFDLRIIADELDRLNKIDQEIYKESA